MIIFGQFARQYYRFTQGLLKRSTFILNILFLQNSETNIRYLIRRARSLAHNDFMYLKNNNNDITEFVFPTFSSRIASSICFRCVICLIPSDRKSLSFIVKNASISICRQQINNQSRSRKPENMNMSYILSISEECQSVHWKRFKHIPVILL